MPVLGAACAGTLAAGFVCDYYRIGSPDHLLFLLPVLLPPWIQMVLASGRFHRLGARLGPGRRWAMLGAAAGGLLASRRCPCCGFG
jgi:hypothetical protein